MNATPEAEVTLNGPLVITYYSNCAWLEDNFSLAEFLATLILASKFSQDKYYSNHACAWAKLRLHPFVKSAVGGCG